jgi:hypothetical protein
MNNFDCQIYRDTVWVDSFIAWIKKGDWFRLGKSMDTYVANEDAVHDEDGWHVDADWHRKNSKEDVKREF